MHPRCPLPLLSLCLLLAGCPSPEPSVPEPPDLCSDEGALAGCLSPTLSPAYYVAQSLRYFDTMDYTVELEEWPPYAELVARWEWPPWLKLTAYTRETIEATDTLLLLYPSRVLERDCQAFETQPFGRCRVVNDQLRTKVGAGNNPDADSD